MKNIKYLFSLLCLAMVLFACEDDYDRKAGGDITSVNPVLNIIAQNQHFVDKPESDSDNGKFLFRASWTRPRFSYDNGLAIEVESIKYSLQLGVLGEEFEKIATIAETEELFFDIYSGPIYKLIEELTGSELEETQNLEIRVVANYDSAEGPLASNSETIIFAPTPKEPIEPWDPVEFDNQIQTSQRKLG